MTGSGAGGISDSSGNSDHSYISNSSMVMPNNFIPTFYNKKMKKNYVSFIKGTKGHKSLNGIVNSINVNGYGNNTINHASPTSQGPLSAKYNQANLARVGGLMGSNLIPINNTTAVTTHVNTSGHIIKTSTSAPKVSEIDSTMISPSYFYNRRYSLPFNKKGNMNLTLNDTTTSTNANLNDSTNQDALVPPLNGHLNNSTMNTTYTSLSQQINELNRHSRNNSARSSTSSTQVDDDQTLHSLQSNSEHNSLDKMDEGSKVNIHSYTKTLKPIAEGIVSTNSNNNDDQGNENNYNNNNNNTLLPTSNLKTTIPKKTSMINPPTATTTTHTKNSHENNNNYTLYKTSASTNLYALNYKMISGRTNKPLSHRQALLHTTKSSSVESAASTNHVTPIYF